MGRPGEGLSPYDIRKKADGKMSAEGERTLAFVAMFLHEGSPKRPQTCSHTGKENVYFTFRKEILTNNCSRVKI